MKVFLFLSIVGGFQGWIGGALNTPIWLVLVGAFGLGVAASLSSTRVPPQEQ